MINNQPPEPAVKSDGTFLEVHSVFYTIQGEGPFSGYRSIFVRLAGCNLQCPGCDTEYTSSREAWIAQHLAIFVTRMAIEEGAPNCLVVVTGGEPTRQNLGVFLTSLAEFGHHVQIESNGVLAPDEVTAEMIADHRVTLVISPKTAKINPEARALASCFKYVLDHRSVDPKDGLPIRALEHPAAKGVARPRPGAPVYINPYDVQDPIENKRNLAAASLSSMKHGYILGVQLHKIAELA